MLMNENLFIKLIPLIVLLLVCSSLNGQLSLTDDTIRIDDVKITPKQISSGQPGYKFFEIDKTILKDYSLYSLTDLLNGSTPLYIKHYGSGGTATSSFRGTSAGHTLVNWNGVNINDPMLGQSDFSLIPSGMLDNVMVCFGGASMDLGNGGIGGVINLENEPSWESNTTAELTSAVGSFGRYTGLLKVNTGNDNFQSVTKAYAVYSKNNYPYIDEYAVPEPIIATREHNQVVQKNFMQEIYYRKSKNILSARIWYQTTQRDLPGSLLYGYSGEEQDDNAFRTIINYDVYKRKNEYFLTAAWMRSDMNYLSTAYSLESTNKVNTMVFKSGLTRSLGQYTRLKIIFNEEMNMVESNNYLENKKRNNTSLTLSAERKNGKRLAAAILVRETLDNDRFLIPDLSAGIEYRILPDEEQFIKLNASRNSKIVSLNDLYWNPGGNPDLKNEYAFSYELGYNLKKKISSASNTGFELGWFKNYIRDLIQWQSHPEFSWWIAQNIGRVNTSGLESSAYYQYSEGKLEIHINADYSYTNAVSLDPETSGNQLIYVPKNQANGVFRFGYSNFYSIWRTDYVGNVFTSQDNAEQLDGYMLNDFLSGIKLNFSGLLIDLSLRIENLFDVRYQTIEYYPQPGRSFLFSLSLRTNTD